MILWSSCVGHQLDDTTEESGMNLRYCWMWLLYFEKKGGVWVETMDPKKWTFFPPLTLVLCDSGRDNQLRVKSPPMIVIINLKTQTKQTKNNKFRGDDETHHGTVERTDAKWQMPDRMHMNAASQGGYTGADLCVH